MPFQEEATPASDMLCRGPRELRFPDSRNYTIRSLEHEQDPRPSIQRWQREHALCIRSGIVLAWDRSNGPGHNRAQFSGSNSPGRIAEWVSERP
jgi:hypothetical protein